LNDIRTNVQTISERTKISLTSVFHIFLIENNTKNTFRINKIEDNINIEDNQKTFFTDKQNKNKIHKIGIICELLEFELSRILIVCFEQFNHLNFKVLSY